MTNIFKNIAALVVCLLPACAFATYTISPVELTVGKDKEMSSLTIKNENDHERHFQLMIFKKVKENNTEVLKETKDVIATPLVFKLPTGKEQLVRVRLKNDMYATAEKAYVVSVKELPHGKGKGSYVNFISEFQVPLTVK